MGDFTPQTRFAVADQLHELAKQASDSSWTVDCASRKALLRAAAYWMLLAQSLRDFYAINREHVSALLMEADTAMAVARAGTVPPQAARLYSLLYSR